MKNREMKVKVLVVAHKDFDDSIVPKEGYQVIKVGNKIDSSDALSRGWLTDDTGENIAVQNPYFCELTAHYWAWKNLKDVDIIGLVHYRRFFLDYVKSDSFSKNILSKEAILNIFSRYEVIIPFWEGKVGDGFRLKKGHPESNGGLWTLHEIILESYPAMLDAYDYVACGNFITYCNMAIMRKADFDAYSCFLFDVLKKYEERSAAIGRPKDLRSYGYFGELLLPVWVRYRFKESEKYHLDIRNSEFSTLSTRTLLGKLRVYHSILSFVRYLQFLKLKYF